MITQQHTGLFLICWIIAALAWEAVAIKYGIGATISETTWFILKKYPFVALMAGILMGHLFWQKGDTYQ